MSESTEQRANAPTRILVALDASATSQAALRAAAKLAAAMQAELLGLFIEDQRLLQLCNSPFCREVGFYTAAVRPLESQSIERQLRVRAEELRRTLARVAGESQVRWSFQVRRGGIEEELLREAADALLLSLGRTSGLARQGLGATARAVIQQARRPLLLLGGQDQLTYPLTLVYNGSPSSDRALALAAQLSHQANQPLRILLVAIPGTLDQLQTQLATYLQTQGVEAIVITVTDDHTTQRIKQAVTNQALVLPIEYNELLNDRNGPVLLVP